MEEIHSPDDIVFMRRAIELAEKARELDEVPVGAVIVRDGKIIAEAYNTRETTRQATHHAEILAIEAACRALGGWRLPGATLYVTMEPCAMCAGAIINARIPRVVYGASDSKFGACRSVCSLFDMAFNHHPKVESGLREEEAAALMTEFFQNLRLELRSRPKWKPKDR